MRKTVLGINLSVLFTPRRKWAAAVAISVAAILVIRVALFILLPAGDGKLVREVDFPKGSSVRRLADNLEKSGVMGSASLFLAYARLTGAAGKVKAGTYQFNDGLKPGEILRMLVDGEVYEKRFAVPEGYSIYQIAEMLDARKLFARDEFLRECRNPGLLKEAGIHAKSVEGYLYPSTYNLLKVDTPAELVRMMTGQFRKVYEDRFHAMVAPDGLSRQEVITLASMVEKEAITAEEKPLIASVFFNRLKKGMPLQSDPTAVYGVRAFGGKVSGQDVRRKSPYNTYLIKGLPPGPIGNPGSEAIEAVLKPAATGYYYFVARNDGTHQFSATLAEHNRAVQLYLKGAQTEGASPQYRNDRPNLTGRR